MLGVLGPRAGSDAPPSARCLLVMVTPEAFRKRRFVLERSFSPAFTALVSLFCTVIVQCVAVPLGNVASVHSCVMPRPDVAAAAIGLAAAPMRCGWICALVNDAWLP